MFILTLLFLLSYPVEVWPGDIYEMKLKELNIHHSPSLREGAEEIARIYPVVKQRLQERLKLRLTFKPVVLLIHGAEFNKMTGGRRLVTAFVIPPSDLIVINYPKVLNSSLSLELTLMHELCHLMLHKYIEDAFLPTWLDEGVCQWVSGGMTDIINFDSKKFLKEATITNNYLPLRTLRHGFPLQDKALMLSYSESRSLIEYIDETYGTDNLLLILKRLHDGEDIEDAVLHTLSITLRELEQEWHSHLKRRYTWYYYIADNIYWFIFLLAALITFTAYLRMRIRMKTFFKDEEDDGGERDSYWNR